MKLFTTALIALTLTACGTADQMTDQQKQSAVSTPELAEAIPDFKSWQMMEGATDQCFQADPDNVHCQTEFQMPASDRNCQDTTFKFIVIKGGYMYIQTVEHVIVRQGEPHVIEFKGQHETHNVQDEFATAEYHVYRCYGQNGQVVRL